MVDTSSTFGVKKAGRLHACAVILFLCVALGLPRSAEAAYGYTDLFHHDTAYYMTGYSLTVLDWWESIVGEYYYEPCECYLTYFNHVLVGGALYTPSNAVAAFSPPVADADGEVVIVLPQFRPWQTGTWSAIGAHFVETDYYNGFSYVGTISTPLPSSQDTASVNCIVPTGELTISDGWAGSDGANYVTVHKFKGQLLPGAAQFAGSRVQELAYQPAVDGCWDPRIVGIPEPYHLTPGIDWTVGANNTWQWDYVGFDTAAVTIYRQERARLGLPMPCTATAPQEMMMTSCPGAPGYAWQNLVITLGNETVSVTRAGVGGSVTWPTGPPPGHGDGLDPGETLEPDEYIESPNGQYRLVYQGGDGHLVLYGPSGPTWWNSTFYPGGFIAMQGDGNFVHYDSSGTDRWSSGTSGYDGAYLRMQDDGNLVIYHNGSAIWWRP